MKAAAVLALVLASVGVAPAAGVQGEVESKGRAVMEEYRADRGHWVYLNTPDMVDHMVGHLGPNGVAFAGFFITTAVYGNEQEPGEELQARDPLLSEFKALAEDQSWLDECCPGMSRKTWTFGYGHDKNIAQEVGCDDIGTWLWHHACIIAWKTSPDGGHLDTHHTVHFGHDHTKGVVPKPADIRKYVIQQASKKVFSHGAEL